MIDPLVVFDHNRERTDALRDMLAGRPSFLVCGGPSANDLDLSLLRKRGLWSIAVNNMAAYFHANAFVCSDPPSKFHDGIWLDPTIMKLLPFPKLTDRSNRGSIRTKGKDGFSLIKKADGKYFCTADCPNVWGFGRRTWWGFDDTFFTDPEAAWGNGNTGVIRTGNPKVFCTMLLAIRLLYYLGSRRIFLVGVDFNIKSDAGYAFQQSRTPEAVNSNTQQYGVVNYGLCEMVRNGVFAKAGVEIYNCNPQSGLRAFPHVPYAAAVKSALVGFPTEPFDISGWYEKPQENKK